MEKNRALELARRHRERVERHVRGAVAKLDDPPALARGPLARDRWTLLQMLREYHLFKRIEIFGPAIRSGSAEQVATALRLQDACLEGWRGFCDYTLRWSATDIVPEWDRYRPAMLATARTINGRLEAEERQIMALLAGATRTRRLLG